MKRAARLRSGAGAGQMAVATSEVKQISAFHERYYDTVNI